jgi:ATP-dependent helicase/nuclease subunit B
VAAPASLLEAFARSAGVGRVDFPEAPVLPLSCASSEAQLREAVALAAGGEGRDAEAAALAASLEEGWLVEAQALGAMEAERLQAFLHSELPSGRFTGAVTAPDLAAALAQRCGFGADTPLSASTLGKFGQCAFQGFARTVLRVEQPESAGEALDARGQGSFWHAVVEQLVPRLRGEGLLGRPWREVPPALVEAALDAAASAFQEGFSVGHPRLFSLACERARWMVRRLLDAPHHGLPFAGLLPEAVETSFGRASSPEDWREVRLPASLPGEREVYLTGTVDRLDAGPGGVGVLDYKANRKRDAARELLTTDFQLPFYLHAVRARGEPRALHAGWLVLKTGEFQPFETAGGVERLLATDATARERARAEGLPNLANAVHGLVQRAQQGDFGARPSDCGFCPYGGVCRIGELRKEKGRW